MEIKQINVSCSLSLSLVFIPALCMSAKCNLISSVPTGVLRCGTRGGIWLLFPFFPSKLIAFKHSIKLFSAITVLVCVFLLFLPFFHFQFILRIKPRADQGPPALYVGECRHDLDWLHNDTHPFPLLQHNTHIVWAYPGCHGNAAAPPSLQLSSSSSCHQPPPAPPRTPPL